MSEGLNEDGERKDLKLNLSACSVSKICCAVESWSLNLRHCFTALLCLLDIINGWLVLLKAERDTSIDYF